MNIEFSIEEAVAKRYSVRNYREQEIDLEKRKAIESFIASLDNPFGNTVTFQFFIKRILEKNKSLELMV